MNNREFNVTFWKHFIGIEYRTEMNWPVPVGTVTSIAPNKIGIDGNEYRNLGIYGPEYRAVIGIGLNRYLFGTGSLVLLLTPIPLHTLLHLAIKTFCFIVEFIYA